MEHNGMDDMKVTRETLVDTVEKLPWTDPEFAQAAIVDHTQGGRSVAGVESAAYRVS